LIASATKKRMGILYLSGSKKKMAAASASETVVVGQA